MAEMLIAPVVQRVEVNDTEGLGLTLRSSSRPLSFFLALPCQPKGNDNDAFTIATMQGVASLVYN